MAGNAIRSDSGAARVLSVQFAHFAGSETRDLGIPVPRPISSDREAAWSVASLIHITSQRATFLATGGQFAAPHLHRKKENAYEDLITLWIGCRVRRERVRGTNRSATGECRRSRISKSNDDLDRLRGRRRCRN
jgi:hypothetical protein